MILFLEQTPQSKNIFKYKKTLLKILKSSSQTALTVTKKASRNDKKEGSNLRLEKSAHPSLVLVLGNEVSGISKNLLNYATHAVEIPMYGTKESLNVAVAFGVAIYALKAD